MDVLTLFRKYGKSLDSIVESDDEKSIKFGDESVVVAMSDPIRLKDGNRTGFTVASLYYFLKIVKKEKQKVSAYVQFCRKNKVKYLPTLMQKPIWKYVEGSVKETHSDLRKYIEPFRASSDAKNDDDDGAMDVEEDETDGSRKMFANLLTKQISLTDRCTFLGGKTTHNFKWIQKIAHELTEVSQKRKVRTKDRLANEKRKKAAKIRTPIIVVPAEFSAILTLFNAKQFLKDGKYESTKEVRKKGGKKDDVLIVPHTFSGGQTFQFRIVDVISTLSAIELKSIVCVVASGKPWQFDSWKSRLGDTAKIFKHAKGIHFKYEHEVINNVIKKWKIEVLSLSESRRHLDRSIRDKFWKAIETFIKVNRPDVFG